MRLLPVIDLKAGRVVRGVSGQRSAYQPWTSPLTPRADPAELAACLCERFAARDVYVADLEALGDSEPQWPALTAISDAGLRLWLDAGIGSPADAARVMEFDADGRRCEALVVGLESLSSPQSLDDVLQVVPRERVVFSLDLFDGRPWNSAPSWLGWDVPRIAQHVWQLGLRRMIVLDVARVGTNHGPGLDQVLKGLHSAYPHLELIAGGGIRDGSDVARLNQAGCGRVLVATALHTGQITPAEILANSW